MTGLLGRWPFAVFAVSFLFLSHLPFLSLPYFWDELGQFVPAALDIYQSAAWVPQTTLPNVHPPGVMAYLAAVWSLVGYSIAATRLAMLCLAAVSLWAMWLLGETLGVASGPRRFAIVLLLVSPVFYTQAMMAQLELGALLFSVAAMALYLRGRYSWSLVACVVLVLTKETGALVPLLLAGDAAWRRQYRWAACLAGLPLVCLAAWLIVLRVHTGQILGNQEFAQYNLFYPLHPVRLGAALLRRAYYLLGSSFHWIGTLALVTSGWRGGVRWRLPGLFLVLHAGEVSVLGGATLERYLLPVLPILYLAMASACWAKPVLWRAALVAGLAASLWVKPPYPFPFENNLAFTDFVKLQQEAAASLEEHRYPAPVHTAWPFTDALRRPEFGYVRQPVEVQALEAFGVADLAPVHDGTLVIYTRTWKPEYSVLNWQCVEQFLQRFYGYQEAAPAASLQGQGWLKREELAHSGQKLMILTRAPASARQD